MLLLFVFFFCFFLTHSNEYVDSFQIVRECCGYFHLAKSQNKTCSVHAPVRCQKKTNISLILLSLPSGLPHGVRNRMAIRLYLSKPKKLCYGTLWAIASADELNRLNSVMNRLMMMSSMARRECAERKIGYAIECECNVCYLMLKCWQVHSVWFKHANERNMILQYGQVTRTPLHMHWHTGTRCSQLLFSIVFLTFFQRKSTHSVQIRKETNIDYFAVGDRKCDVYFIAKHNGIFTHTKTRICSLFYGWFFFLLFHILLCDEENEEKKRVKRYWWVCLHYTETCDCIWKVHR